MRKLAFLLGLLGAAGLLAFGAYAAVVDRIETPYAVAGGVSALLLAAWLALDRGELLAAARTRGARYSLNAGLLVLVVGAIAVAANVLAVRYDERLDLTASQRFALAPQTLSVLAGLDQDVQILAFFPTGAPEQVELETRLDSYVDAAGGRLVVSFHDPVREPLLAQQHDITSSWGTVVLQAGDAEQRLESDFSEEALTNALIRASSGVEHEVCFVTGHGELDPDEDMDPAGIGGAITRLEGQNYTVRTVNLVRDGGVPATCSLVLVADPQTEWLPAERELLAAWVAGGGAALVMLDPTHAPVLASDLSRYGLDLGDDIVLERNPRYQLMGGDETYLVLDPDSWAPHPVTEVIEGMSILRVARSVSPAATVPAGLTVTPLGRTTSFGWAETTLDGVTVPEPDGEDIIGSVPVVAVVEVTDPAAVRVAEDVAAFERKAGGRLLVFGDSDFATNELLDQGANADLFLNSIAWLVGEEDQVSIRANPASTGSLEMNLLQGLAVWLLCLLVVPGIAVGFAIGTWRTRRDL